MLLPSLYKPKRFLGLNLLVNEAIEQVVAFRTLLLTLEHQVTQARINTKFLEIFLCGYTFYYFIFHLLALSDCSLK